MTTLLDSDDVKYEQIRFNKSQFIICTKHLNESRYYEYSNDEKIYFFIFDLINKKTYQSYLGTWGTKNGHERHDLKFFR